MRVSAAALVIVALCIQPICAQSRIAANSSDARVRHGKTKVLIGLALIGAGVLAVPVTAARSDTGPDGTEMATGLALVGIGSTLVWWGVRDQRRALKPSTSVGVMVGRSNGVQIRRSW
jgi:protein-S-isoprenylcysteine O-methyltransferase Ste14